MSLGALLTSCFSNFAASSNMKGDADAASGRVFGTIGTTGHEPRTNFRMLQFRAVGGASGADNRGGFKYSNSVGGLTVLASILDGTPTDFSHGDSKGTYFSASLRPGDYEVYQAIFMNAPASGFASAGYERAIRPVVFTVETGKATYLGEFLSGQAMGRNDDGIPVDAGGYFLVSDQLARDSAIAGAKGEPVESETIINASSSFGPDADPIFRRSPND